MIAFETEVKNVGPGDVILWDGKALRIRSITSLKGPTRMITAIDADGELHAIALLPEETIRVVDN